jgi:DNA-binding SARP family transcriptional activator
MKQQSTTIRYWQGFLRCGKPSCWRCREGRGHGPYWQAEEIDASGQRHHRYIGTTLPADVMKDTAQVSSTHGRGGPPPLRIWLLDGLRVERGGELIGEEQWRRSSVPKLLALLLLHPGGLLREQVAEQLWPEADPEASTLNLRTTLSALRHLLEPPQCRASGRQRYSYRLPQGEDPLHLHLTEADWVDIRRFSAAPVDRLSLPDLIEVVDLYRGELLPEYRYEEWTLGPREALRQRWFVLSLELARRLAAAGRAPDARARLRSVLAADNTQEEAARLLMTLLAEHGDRAEALRVYNALAHALATELATTPDELTCGLAQRLQRQDAVLLLPPSRLRLAEELRRQIDALVAQPPTPETAHRLAWLCAERAFVLEARDELAAAQHEVERGRRALAGLDCPAELARLYLAEAMIHSRQSHGQATHETACRAEELAMRARDDRLVAEALRLRAQAAQQMGRIEEGIELARRSAALYERVGEAAGALLGQRIVAYCTWRAARFAEAEALQRQNLVLACRLAQVDQEAYVRCGLGSALLELGKLAAAKSELEAAAHIARQLDDHYLILATEYHLANLWLQRAYLLSRAPARSPQAVAALRAQQQAQARFEQLLRMAEQWEDQYLLVFAAIDLAGGFCEWGEAHVAESLLARAEDALPTIANTAAQGWLLLVKSELTLARGHTAWALSLAAEAAELLAAASPAGVARAQRALAMGYVAVGDTVLARRYQRAALEAARTYGQTVETIRTQQALGLMR